MKNEQRDKAASVFAAYNQKDVVYITSDNQAFFEGHFAEAHAQNLKDKEVVNISRLDIESQPGVVDVSSAEETTENKGTDEEIVANIIKMPARDMGVNPEAHVADNKGTDEATNGKDADKSTAAKKKAK